MQILFLILFLFFPSVVYSAPSTTVSISPAAVDATTITASDVNTRNSAISTWANVHDHNDIDQTGNTLAVGDATAGNKTIQANNADTNKPFIRYDDTNDRWIASRDGSTVETFLVLTGSTLSHFILPQSPSLGQHLVHNGITWSATEVYGVGSFTRDTSLASGTQDITGLGFQPRMILFYAVENNVDSEMSIGFNMAASRFVVLDRNNVNANDWSTTSGYSIYLLESGVNDYRGYVHSFSSDGFTITWEKTGTPTGTATINYVAFR